MFLFSLALHRSFSFPPSRRVVCRSISSPFHPLRFFFDTVSRGWLLRLVRVDFWHRSPHADHGRRFSVAFLRVVFGSRVCTCVAVCAAVVCGCGCARVCVLFLGKHCAIGTIPELLESRRRYLYCHIIAGVECHQLVPGMIAANKRETISHEVASTSNSRIAYIIRRKSVYYRLEL